MEDGWRMDEWMDGWRITHNYGMDSFVKGNFSGALSSLDSKV